MNKINKQKRTKERKKSEVKDTLENLDENKVKTKTANIDKPQKYL